MASFQTDWFSFHLFRPLPNSHVVSIDSIFGDDIDASAILPPADKKAARAANFASQSMEVEQEVGFSKHADFISRFFF